MTRSLAGFSDRVQRVLARIDLRLLAVAGVVYAFWLSYPTPGRGLIPRPDTQIGVMFNSMLEHLLRGEFDVDPDTVGLEGFLRDGKTYAYWGILPALLRLPLLLVPGGLTLNVTFLSCLLAVMLAAGAKLMTLQRIFREVPSTPATRVVYWTMAATLLLSGAQVGYLRPHVYVEVCLWAAAFGAVLVYCAVDGLLARRFPTRLLVVMATAAGLALNTRVTTGLGLYAAVGLLLLGLLLMPGQPHPPTGAGTILRRAVSARFVVPLLILIGFLGVAFVVNYGRWGDALTFMDTRYYLMNDAFPGRHVRLETYGFFNLARVPFGLGYYLFPAWAFSASGGHLFFEAEHIRLMEMVELPPSSFLLSDALLVACFAYGLWAVLDLRRALPVSRVLLGTIAAGLGLCWLLMLSAVSMAYRYRLEFYPLLELGAFVGVLLLVRDGSPSLARRWAMVSGALVSIACSTALVVIFKLSPYGSSLYHLADQDVITLFRNRSWK